MFLRPGRLCLIPLLLPLSSASRYFSGTFPPYPACDAQYNAPCSPANALKAVQQAVSELGGLADTSAVNQWLDDLNSRSYDNGIDGSGFGPMVVKLDGVNSQVLADPENPTLDGEKLDDMLILKRDDCNQSELANTDCARVKMTLFQEGLLSEWQAAQSGDGWGSWVWTRWQAPSDPRGTVIPEKKVGYMQQVTTPLGNLLVSSSFSDQRLASGFASDSACRSANNELCSVELSRMLVGDGLAKMMMASTPSELTKVFHDITFSDTYVAGSGFYIFVYRFGDPGSPGARGECVAHGANSGHVGQNLPEILLKVGNTGVDGDALHLSFLTAAEDGGGWVAYEWKNSPSDPGGFKIAFIAGTEKFGTKYYLGVGFNHKHATIAPGPHCSTCSMKYSYFCAIRNTYMLMGHVQAFLLTDVDEYSAWSQLTSSRKVDESLTAVDGLVETAGYKFGGVGDGDAFYSFVYDFNGTCVAHAANGGLVGRTLWGIIAHVNINSGCDSDDLNCGTTLVDGWQLNEDFKNAAAGGGGWVQYTWRSNMVDPAIEKVAYLVKISKYGRSFYAGVGYNNVVWNPESAEVCDSSFAGTCAEDGVLAMVGHLTAVINNAQSQASLDAAFANATARDDLLYRSSGGFVMEVYDDSQVCAAYGGSPDFVGKSLERIFLDLGSKALGADQYADQYKGAPSGGFFTYLWQADGMEKGITRKAFAQKASYKPLGSYTEKHYYVVASFVDAIQPPRCNFSDPSSWATDCPASSVCKSSGYCSCVAGTIANFTTTGACGDASGCACETEDYTMTCEVNDCPAGKFGLPDQRLPDPSGRSCQECDPGKFAASAQSSACSVCIPGRYQDLPAQQSCKNCSAGTSINSGSSTACESCAEGWFQSTEGNSQCDKCPYGAFSSGTGNIACAGCPMADETTPDRAALSKWECVCKEGTYREYGHSKDNNSHRPCHQCPVGMDCAEGNGEPVLLKGFWAAEQDSDERDYSVFLCRDTKQCPGGIAGTCASGREGIGCANCKPAHQADSTTGSCDECGATSTLPILLICVLCIVGFVAMAMYAKVDVSRIKLNTLAVGICMGQTAVAVQALGVFKVLEVDWVQPIRGFLNIVSVISFDLDVLHISCMFPDSNVLGKYVLKVFIFPTGIAILCLIFFIMKTVFKQKVNLDHIVNSVGLLFLVLFLTLAMLSLNPFHCVSSPNGTMSLASNPSVICDGNSTWTWLAVFGSG